MAKRRHSVIHIPKDPPEGPSLLPIIILLVIPEFITKIIGVYLAYKRFKNERTRRRYQMFRRYANAIGLDSVISIRELAARLDMPTENLAADLQEMIDNGMIGGSSYIDRSHMKLYLDSEAQEEDSIVDQVINVFVSPENRARTVAEAKAAQSQSAPEPPKAQAEPPRSKSERPEPQRSFTDSDNFEAKLRQIRELNDAIENGPVSERIDRIGELTASIFRVVREKPERAEEVRKFMNYYLPTTLKLLKSYSLMEKQSYQGENIVASRKKIEDVLDTLVHAFEQQQDRLFRTEALDVASDISVLETMMTSDGLVEEKNALHPRAMGGGEGR